MHSMRSVRVHASASLAPCINHTITMCTVTEQDRAYVRQAVDLAARALGQTHPNPAVGCVIVKDGQVDCGIVSRMVSHMPSRRSLGRASIPKPACRTQRSTHCEPQVCRNHMV